MVDVENVVSVLDYNDEMEAFLRHFKLMEVNGAWCSGAQRRRMVASSRPPVVGQVPVDGKTMGRGDVDPSERKPPCFDGNLDEFHANSILDSDNRKVQQEGRKKLNCIITRKNSSQDAVLVEEDEDGNKIPVRLTPTEVERSLGYEEHELGITSRMCLEAVEARIRNHNFERDGPLIRLGGCANEKGFKVEEVSDVERYYYLGNSQNVNILEALRWNDRLLFPKITMEPRESDEESHEESDEDAA